MHAKLISQDHLCALAIATDVKTFAVAFVVNKSYVYAAAFDRLRVGSRRAVAKLTNCSNEKNGTWYVTVLPKHGVQLLGNEFLDERDHLQRPTLARSWLSTSKDEDHEFS